MVTSGDSAVAVRAGGWHNHREVPGLVWGAMSFPCSTLARCPPLGDQFPASLRIPSTGPSEQPCSFEEVCSWYHTSTEAPQSPPPLLPQIHSPPLGLSIRPLPLTSWPRPNTTPNSEDSPALASLLTSVPRTPLPHSLSEGLILPWVSA